jgi:hypothetical protein
MLNAAARVGCSRPKDALPALYDMIATAGDARRVVPFYFN